jgi:hypothetical protein
MVRFNEMADAGVMLAADGSTRVPTARVLFSAEHQVVHDLLRVMQLVGYRIIQVGRSKRRSTG